MTDFQTVVLNLRDRANHSRRVYNMNMAVVIILVVVLVVLFVFARGWEIRLGEMRTESILVLLLGNAIVRIGAVVIAIYSVQRIFNFARYHIRIAHHLDSTADALEISQGKYKKLEVLHRALVPTSIDVGKPPTAPTDKMTNALQDLVKQIPDKGK